MIITRDILAAFKKWKTSTDRKPILIKGARQIGKTWVMEEFGRQCYEHYVKFDFDEQQELTSVFQTTKDPHRIIKEFTRKPVPGPEMGLPKRWEYVKIRISNFGFCYM